MLNFFSMKNFSIGRLFALFFASAAVCGVVFITQDQVLWHELAPAPSPSPLNPVATADRVEAWSLADVLRARKRRDVLLVDARSRQNYEYGHIEGAINIPADIWPELDAESLHRIMAAQQLIVYCNGVNCGVAHQTARHLRALKGPRVAVYQEGWPEWRSCALPMDISSQMKADVAREGS
jgi:rhodanese-related sulfurtransferase